MLVPARVPAVRGPLILLLVALVALLGSTPAAAYWPSTGSGTSSVATGSLGPPSAVTVPARTSTATVSVGWTASPGTPAPTGYFVNRVGTATVAACGSSPTALVPGTACTDTAVPDGNYTYTVTAVYRSWTAAGVASAVVVAAKPARVTFTGQPSTTVAGVKISPAVKVSVQTVGGSTVPTSGISVTVAIGNNPGGGALSGTLTATTNAVGVATFADLSLEDIGSGYTLVASSAGLSPATSNGFIVRAAPASQLAITSPAVAGPTSAGASLGPITVESRDLFDNPSVAPAGGTVVSLSSSSSGTAIFAATASGTSISSVTIPAGQTSVSFYYGDTSVGTPTITVSNLTFDDASQTATITAGPTTQLMITSAAVSGPADSSAVLGPITVQISDAFGNPTLAPAGGTAVSLASNSTGTRVFSLTSGGAVVTTVTIPAQASSASFYYGDTRAGTPTITASRTGLTSGIQSETVSGGAPTVFVFTSAAVNGIVSATASLGPITVLARDAFGNPATAPASGVAVRLTSTSTGTKVFSAAQSGPVVTTVTIVAGSSTVSFYYGDTKVGTPTLTAASTGVISATQRVTITAAPASALAFTNTVRSGVATATATRGSFTVQSRDAFGNAAAAPAGGLVFSLGSTSTGSTVFAGTSAGAAVTTRTIPAGSSSAVFYYGDTKAGKPTLTASRAGFTSGSQVTTIVAATAKKLVFAQPPTDAVRNVVIGPPITAQLQDIFGNVTTSAAKVTIAILNNPGGGSLNGSTSVNAVGGVVTFSGLSISLPGVGYTLRVTGSGLASATSGPITVS